MWGEETTVCPRSSDPFYVVTYYIKLVTTSWTHSICKQDKILDPEAEIGQII